MKKTLIVIFFLIGTYRGFSQKVYNATNDSTAKVHIVFYEVQDSLQADLWVYQVDSIYKIYKEGQWYLIGNPISSFFNYSITNDATKADIKIFFVSDSKNAGWQNSSKRYLYIYARRRN